MAEATTTADPIIVSVHIEAPPEDVFEFFVDPAKLTRWMGSHASLDPEVGGEFVVTINSQATTRGRYTVVDPPNRVEFTWGWEGRDELPPGASTVTVDLTATDGGTDLRVTHAGLSVPTSGGHREGWDRYLGRLQVCATGGDPGPDEWADAANTPTP